MKIVDCFWEIENLGKKVCEISIEQTDLFNTHELERITQDYNYVVIKVPMNHSSFNFGLSKMGYVMVETQIGLSKKYADFKFDDRLVKTLVQGVDERIIFSEKELDELISHMTPDMFSTDRIYLDSFFDSNASMIRYSNWIRNEFINKTAIIKNMIYEGEIIGFGMCRDNKGVLDGLLGGIYKEKQSEGYGLLTSCFEFLVAKKYSRPFRVMHTAISSNNVPMLQIYNYLNFRIDKMTYVYIKHLN